MKRTLLIEIGLEELPAEWVEPARDAFRARVLAFLQEMHLSYGDVRAYATPRRLAVQAEAVAERQQDREEMLRGPRRKIAVSPDGEWTEAARGFARSRGVPLEALSFEGEGDDAVLIARRRVEGRPAAEVLPGLKDVIEGLPFPKTMRWGTETLRYGRPIRWLVVLFGEAVVPLEIAGVTSGRTTYGHRTLSSGPIELASADDYAAALERGFVVADVEARRARIVEGMEKAASARGLRVPADAELLAEVTELVEYPTVFIGRFDPAFLALPRAVLVTTMRRHQRYFPAFDGEGRLAPYFVGVRNGTDEALDVVVRGNEKVLAARLADARFFYEADLKQSIEAFNAKLREIAFHAELGSMAEKRERLITLAGRLSDALALSSTERAKVARAAEIAKFDLATQMVYEFTELQGAVGEAYALAFGEDADVARAVREHWRPVGQGDGPPEGTIGAVVGLADKLDTLVGFFGLGFIPSGSEDPFALRRAALGVISILRAYALPLAPLELFAWAREAYGARADVFRLDGDALLEALWDFLAPRIKAQIVEDGVRHDFADAVVKQGGVPLSRLFERALALARLSEEATFKSTIESFVRVHNMAQKARREGLLAGDPAARLMAEAVRSRLSAPSEAALLAAYDAALRAFAAAPDGAAELEALRPLVPHIERFFIDVLVMAEDPAVRESRLALIGALDALFGRYADFRAVVV